MSCLSPSQQEPHDSTGRQVVTICSSWHMTFWIDPSKSWLNTLYLSMDANFKLKQKERGFSDPPLSNGLVYMVSNEKLMNHLVHCSKNVLIKEVSILNYDGPWPALNPPSDQYLHLHHQRSQSGIYKVCKGIHCDWCWQGWLCQTQVQATKQCHWSAARWMVSEPIIFYYTTDQTIRYSNMDFALMSSLAPSLDAGISPDPHLVWYHVSVAQKFPVMANELQCLSPSPIVNPQILEGHHSQVSPSWTWNQLSAVVQPHVHQVGQMDRWQTHWGRMGADLPHGNLDTGEWSERLQGDSWWPLECRKLVKTIRSLSFCFFCCHKI